MSHEADALKANKTWDLEDLPPGKKDIGCNWIFKIKYHAYETIERYKAKRVILCNLQKLGEDFEEIFAPTSKLTMYVGC